MIRKSYTIIKNNVDIAQFVESDVHSIDKSISSRLETTQNKIWPEYVIIPIKSPKNA